MELQYAVTSGAFPRRKHIMFPRGPGIPEGLDRTLCGLSGHRVTFVVHRDFEQTPVCVACTATRPLVDALINKEGEKVTPEDSNLHATMEVWKGEIILTLHHDKGRSVYIMRDPGTFTAVDPHSVGAMLDYTRDLHFLNDIETGR